jgi:hypothetical protein
LITLPRKRETPDLTYHSVPSQGLNRIDEAIDAWTHAVGAMQKENLTPVEQKQRDQYNSELSAAKTKREDLKANPKQPEGMTTVRSSEIEKLPWRRAMTLLPGLNASGTWDSSVRRMCTYPPPRRNIDALLCV